MGHISIQDRCAPEYRIRNFLKLWNCIRSKNHETVRNCGAQKESRAHIARWWPGQNLANEMSPAPVRTRQRKTTNKLRARAKEVSLNILSFAAGSCGSGWRGKTDLPRPHAGGGLPVFEKFFFFNSLSFTLSPFLRISMALSPLMVTWQAIFSFLLIPKALMVNLALEWTGFWPLISSKTLVALVNLSPDSPTQQFTTNLASRILCNWFSFYCVAIFTINYWLSLSLFFTYLTFIFNLKGIFLSLYIDNFRLSYAHLILRMRGALKLKEPN